MTWNRFILSALLLAAQAGAQPAFLRQTYEVSIVEGSVFVWEPWSDRWERLVPGRTLSEGTVLQVTQGGSASVVVPQVAGQVNVPGKSIVRFMAPSIVRLDAGFLRKIKLNSYFVPMLPSLENPDPEGKDEGPTRKLVHQLDEAWMRFIAVLAKFDINVAFTPPRAPAEDRSGETEWITKLKPIRILRPADKAIVVVDKLPAIIKLAWKPPVPDLNYNIHLWHAEEARRDAIASTSFDYFTLEIRQEGRYFVQVASTDGNWQSAANSIHVALPLTLGSSKAGKPPVVAEVDWKAAKPVLKFPVKNFVYVTSKKPPTLLFQWEVPDSSTPGEIIDTLVVQDGLGGERVRKTVDGGSVSLAFSAHGDYKWFIERRVGTAESFKKLRSEAQAFRIIPSDRDSYKLFTAQSSGVFYLEDY